MHALADHHHEQCSIIQQVPPIRACLGFDHTKSIATGNIGRRFTHNGMSHKLNSPGSEGTAAVVVRVDRVEPGVSVDVAHERVDELDILRQKLPVIYEVHPQWRDYDGRSVTVDSELRGAIGASTV